MALTNQQLEVLVEMRRRTTPQRPRDLEGFATFRTREDSPRGLPMTLASAAACMKRLRRRGLLRIAATTTNGTSYELTETGHEAIEGADDAS